MRKSPEQRIVESIKYVKERRSESSFSVEAVDGTGNLLHDSAIWGYHDEDAVYSSLMDAVDVAGELVDGLAYAPNADDNADVVYHILGPDGKKILSFSASSGSDNPSFVIEGLNARVWDVTNPLEGRWKYTQGAWYRLEDIEGAWFSPSDENAVSYGELLEAGVELTLSLDDV